MNEIDNILKEGNSLLAQVISLRTSDIIVGDVAAKMKSFHTKGRFLLRKVDKVIFTEYSNLFSKTYKGEPWDRWNMYLIHELEQALGILKAISELDPEIIIDKTLNKVFISHGKFTPYFYKVESFIKALGLIPVYDINEPTQGKNINTHIQTLMSNSDFYIILATKETKRGNQNLPNHNVVIEYDRLVQSEVNNMIVLLEEDCKMPSMLQDIIYLGFNSNSLDEVFIRLSSELHKIGLIN